MSSNVKGEYNSYDVIGSNLHRAEHVDR